MNHVYRSIWNELTRTWVAVSEMTKSRGKRSKAAKAVVAALTLIAATQAQAADVNALPTGGQVTAGSATITQTANTLNIHQATQKAALNWQSFNIGANGTVNFVQPNSSSVVLNRIVGNSASEIYGHLNANGQVFLLNPNGILFAKSSQVNVGGIVASTMQLSDSDFLAGNYNFSNAGAGSIINQGLINATGSVNFLGNDISNEGSIFSTSASLVSGNSVALDVSSDGLIRARVTDAAIQANIENSGNIEAAQITLNAGQAKDSLSRVVNNSGMIKATGISMVDGEIVLQGNTVINSGKLNADSLTEKGGRVRVAAIGDTYLKGEATVSATGFKGGDIDIIGNRVAIADNTSIDASGTNGGGNIRVGGDYRGKNYDIQNAKVTYFSSNATLNASAIDNGDGGKIIVWSDETTRAYGSILARGGSNGGNGGFVETSGGYLDVNGIRVAAETLMSGGKAGTWLLDPTDIQITSASQYFSSTIVSTTDTFTSDLTNTPTGTATSIPTATIVTALGLYDVIIDTTGSPATGAQFGDIMISGNNLSLPNSSHSLTLNASRNINLYADVDLASSGGTGDLILNAQAGNIVQDSFSHINVKKLKTDAISFTQTDSNIGNAPSIIASEIELQGGSANLGTVAGTVITAGKLSSNLTGTLTFKNSSSFQINTNGLIAGGAVNLNSFGGAISQIGAITAPSLNASAYSGITLTNTSNNVANFSGSVGMVNDIAITNAGALDLGAVTNNIGSVKVNAGGAVTQSGPISTTSLEIISTGNVTLNAANNINTLAGNVTGTGFQYADVNGFTVGTVGSTAGLVVANGDISLKAGGLDSLLTISNNVQATTGNVTYIADNLAHNAFTTTSGSAGKFVEIKPFTAATSIEFVSAATPDAAGFLRLLSGELSTFSTPMLKAGNSAMTGGIAVQEVIAPSAFSTLSLITGGAITQDAGKTITIANLNADGYGGVTLNEANDVTNLAGHTTANNFAFTDINAINVASVDIINGITATTSGNISLTAGAGGNITIAQAINTPSGTLALTTATTGAISQSASLTATYLTLTGGTGTVTLTNTSNDFDNLAVSSAGIVSVKDLDNITIGTISAGAFTLQSVGDILSLGSSVSTSAGAVDIRSTAGLINLSADGCAP